MQSILNMSDCFVANGKEEHIRVTDINLVEERVTYNARIFTNAPSLRAGIQVSEGGGFGPRIYSICQSGSWTPLRVSKDTLGALMDAENITEDFYHIVQAFRERSLETEEAYGSHWIQRRTANAIEFCYIFKYAEERKRSSDEKWSIRQTGVYCKLHLADLMRSTWVLLHPKRKSLAEDRLDSALCDQIQAPRLLQNPLNMHILVISSYLQNWRAYMVDREEDLLQLSMPVLGTVEELSDELRTSSLVRIRYLESLMQPLVQIFQSTLETLSGLRSIHNTICQRNPSMKELTDTVDALENLVQQTRSYAGYANFLVRKLEGTAQMFSEGLALKSQRIAQEQSNHLYDLARVGQEQNAAICAMTRVMAQDSATIRTITAVTLIFLPTTFVATLFGTQLFYLTSEHKLAVSPQLWILFLVSVPLTAVTILFWRLRSRWYEAQRESFFEDLQGRDLEKSAKTLIVT